MNTMPKTITIDGKNGLITLGFDNFDDRADFMHACIPRGEPYCRVRFSKCGKFLTFVLEEYADIGLVVMGQGFGMQKKENA